MKKILLSVSAMLAIGFGSVSDASAQVIKGFYKQSYKARNNGTFDKGTGLLSLGLGAPYAYGGFYKSSLPPVYAKYEMGIMDEVGVGLIGGLRMGKNTWTDKNYFSTLVGVAGYYHFNKFIPIKNLDVYAGAGFGFNIHNRDGDSKADFQLLFPVGARYYFGQKFGVYLETGYDYLSAVNAGITIKM